MVMRWFGTAFVPNHRITMRCSRFALLIFAACIFSTCTAPIKTYPESDAFFKGDTFTVPPEFQNGTATLEQAKAWARSLMSDPNVTDGNIHADPYDFLPAPRHTILLWDPCNGGTGGNTYMVFEITPNGLKYLGSVGNHPSLVAPDSHNRPRFVTYWRLGAVGGDLILYVLTSNGIRQLACKTIEPHNNDHDVADNNADDLLRESLFTPPVSADLIARTFQLAE
ncbi:MAG: hypothetical protein FWD61_18290 [Phycisphaerales bacterium]|nr:hypothetical protein [Phycisphaerales bacterium]